MYVQQWADMHLYCVKNSRKVTCYVACEVDESVLGQHCKSYRIKNLENKTLLFTDGVGTEILRFTPQLQRGLIVTNLI